MYHLVIVIGCLLLGLGMSACAKMDYLFEQGRGQIGLLMHARSNQTVLLDPKVAPEFKAKIQKIIEYKNYFYQYWHYPPATIYDKTLLLDRPAVMQLVIVSPMNKIQAQTFSFPLVGSFPYLGFFDPVSAEKFKQTQLNLNMAVWMRPVHAYSSLGYFADPILSSFFTYDDFALAELIFHELMHTIFFIKNEVDFNESLANHFSQAMVKEYFADRSEQFTAWEVEREKLQQLHREIVGLVPQLAQQYEKDPCSNPQHCDQILQTFLQKTFFPHLEEWCLQQNVQYCYPLKQQWNNATFAALLTYEDKADPLMNLQRQLKMDLRSFFQYLKDRYKKYRQQDKAEFFSIFLFSGENQS